MLGYLATKATTLLDRELSSATDSKLYYCKGFPPKVTSVQGGQIDDMG